MKGKYFDKEYFLGLDIGTNSVGWAVTDTAYNLLSINNHKTWGSRLFDPAETAVDRRVKRASRRRLQRRKFRLDLLEELFAEEIRKVDPNFFMRLEESQYHLEDRDENNKQMNTLFNDDDYSDADYHEDYPTIYHLRTALLNGEEVDIRLLYLAIHHIVKYRGHFLIEGSTINVEGNASEYILQIFEFIEDELGITELDLTEDKLSEIESILLDKTKTGTDKSKQISKKFDKKIKSLIENVFKLSLGLNCNMQNVFGKEGEYGIVFEDDEFKKVQFDGSYEEKIADLEEFYGDYFALIELSKRLYDAISLSSILIDGKGLSESKVESYKKHQEQLDELRKLLKAVDAELGLTGKDRYYYNVFVLDEEDKRDSSHQKIKAINYVNYSGNAKVGTRATREEFYKFLKKHLEKLTDKKKPMNISHSLKEKANEILKLMELNQYLPLQRDKDNGVIPYQLHKQELESILEKQKQYYPFLEKEEDGLTVAEKIVSLMTFRVPYYVGPLNNYHSVKDGTGYAWVEKKKNEKVLPWNFNEVIDVEKSAENFISNLVNMCTYLRGEQVLPKESILYSEFTLLNELNNIKVNGKKLDTEVKKQMIEDVFRKKRKRMTKKAILDYLVKQGKAEKTDVITGIDEDIKSDMKSYRQLKQVLGNQFDIEMAENLIRWITIFNGEKKILKAKIQSVYGNALDSKMKDILKLSFKDWGRVSKKLLTEIRCESLHNYSIIEAMRETDNNFMELLSNKYDYVEQIETLNKEYFGDDEVTVDPSILDELHVGPGAKRAIWQSIRIVEEIKGIMGHEPKKIFIETTRSNKAQNKKKDSRKEDLLKKYKNLTENDETQHLIKQLEGEDSDKLKIKKLFLYYMQLGKCMYCKDSIDLDSLFTTDYDIDHIYPRSKTKDDSLHDNLVLVHAHCNRDKTDVYPISKQIRDNRKECWGFLKGKNLITETKYNRLVRNTPLTDDELANFIARQIVFTSQSSKATAEVLGRLYDNSKICYVKAENVSDFRHGSSRKMSKDDIPQPFVKCREINDFHHAKDAYLNIVVGNVYDVKFTQNPRNFINKKEQYSLNYVFRYPVIRNNEVAWDPEVSMKTVEKMMANNDVRITKLTKPKTGELFKETVYKASTAKVDSYIPRKSSNNSPLSDVTKYGGYTNMSISYYLIYKYQVENKKKIEEEIRLIPIPIYVGDNKEDIDEYVEKYIRSTVKGKLISFEALGPRVFEKTFVKINGYFYYLGGKSNDRIYLDNAVNLVVAPGIEKVVNNAIKLNTIFEYKAKDTKWNKAKFIENIENDENSIVTNEHLIATYDYLAKKAQANIFKKSKNAIFEKINLPKSRDNFVALTLDRKIAMIIKIVQIMSGAKTSANFKSDLKVSWSRPTISLKINDLEEFKVINQSITGLFVNEIDIIKKDK